jgi:glycogen debranching enzyme
LVQQSYWQGRSWLNYNYFLVGALHQSGLKREAEAAVWKILDAVSRHETLYECYDPLTGTGNGHAEFPWAAGATLALMFGLYREGPLRREPGDSLQSVLKDTPLGRNQRRS